MKKSNMTKVVWLSSVLFMASCEKNEKSQISYIDEAVRYINKSNVDSLVQIIDTNYFFLLADRDYLREIVKRAQVNLRDCPPPPHEKYVIEKQGSIAKRYILKFCESADNSKSGFELVFTFLENSGSPLISNLNFYDYSNINRKNVAPGPR